MDENKKIYLTWVINPEYMLTNLLTYVRVHILCMLSVFIYFTLKKYNES